MATGPVNVEALGQAGMAALNRGDAATARARFEEIVAAGAGDGTVWLMIAIACEVLGDERAVAHALDSTLEIEPDNVRALLMRADRLAATGDRRAAISFYQTVTGLVPEGMALSTEAMVEIDRARATLVRLSEEIFQDLDAHIRADGHDPSTASRRFAQSLAMLSGRTKRYEQQPRSYFFPELPTIPFYPRDAFPWMDKVEAATDDICAELQAAMADGLEFAPYIEAELNRPNNSRDDLLNSDDWSAVYLWRDGRLVPEAAARFPKTVAAMAGLPLETIPGRAPFVLFSKLAPGATIPPHTGFLNTRLVCHLPLIVPPNCRFRVGADERVWEKGKAWVFNDTIEHEAHNGSGETRVILIFNIWRPELTMQEREAVSSLMQGVDRL